MDGMATGRDWDRLAEYVRERRMELGITQEDVRHAGGPSTATMRLIEGALQQAYQPSILARLERALRWKPRSVQQILDGGEPVPLDEAAPRDVAPAPPPAFRWEPEAREGTVFTEETKRASRPAARLIQQRLDELRAGGNANPDGYAMFPGDRGLALGWEKGREWGLPPDENVWSLARALVNIEQAEEAARDESGRHRSGRGALAPTLA